MYIVHKKLNNKIKYLGKMNLAYKYKQYLFLYKLERIL